MLTPTTHCLFLHGIVISSTCAAAWTHGTGAMSCTHCTALTAATHLEAYQATADHAVGYPPSPTLKASKYWQDWVLAFSCRSSRSMPGAVAVSVVELASISFDCVTTFTTCLQTWQDHVQELGSSYGAFPAHEGLWQSAHETAGSLPARLAVEHCVHEARGLDVLPATIQKFKNAGDATTAALLEEVVLPEEVCARWAPVVAWPASVSTPARAFHAHPSHQSCLVSNFLPHDTAP